MNKTVKLNHQGMLLVLVMNSNAQMEIAFRGITFATMTLIVLMAKMKKSVIWQLAPQGISDAHRESVYITLGDVMLMLTALELRMRKIAIH